MLTPAWTPTRHNRHTYCDVAQEMFLPASIWVLLHFAQFCTMCGPLLLLPPHVWPTTARSAPCVFLEGVDELHVCSLCCHMGKIHHNVVHAACVRVPNVLTHTLGDSIVYERMFEHRVCAGQKS